MKCDRNTFETSGKHDKYLVTNNNDDDNDAQNGNDDRVAYINTEKKDHNFSNEYLRRAFKTTIIHHKYDSSIYQTNDVFGACTQKYTHVHLFSKCFIKNRSTSIAPLTGVNISNHFSAASTASVLKLAFSVTTASTTQYIRSV